MNSSSINNLPAEIVRRLLEKGNTVAQRAAEQADRYAKARDEMRISLDELIVRVDPDLFTKVGKLSVSAIDGAMINDSRSIGDLCTAAAVSVGPEEDASDCDVWMELVSRRALNTDIVRGVMSAMELTLAAKSSADVVLVDGSMLSALFNVSHAVSRGSSDKGPLGERIGSLKTESFREAVKGLLLSPRYVAMPKYTTSNEFEDRLPSWLKTQDARTVATMALLPGEMTHFTFRDYGDGILDGKYAVPSLGFSDDDRETVSRAMNGVISCYYRPHPWTPAFRLDLNATASEDSDSQLKAIKAVWETTNHSAGLREPLPLYLADLFAKQISIGASPVVEMASLSAVTDNDARLLLSSGYRT